MNTAHLLGEVVNGAASQGANAELVHLRDKKYSGCTSCFACKDPAGKYYGRCAMRDGLTGVLETAHKADVLVLGTPVYYGGETSLMRAFMERLCFQYHLYTDKKPPLSPRKKNVALIYTMNVKREEMAGYGTPAVIANAKGIMEELFAPCEVFLCCDTKQVNDYSRYEMDVWDVPGKLKRHEEIFPKELGQAFELGARLVA